MESRPAPCGELDTPTPSRALGWGAFLPAAGVLCPPTSSSLVRDATAEDGKASIWQNGRAPSGTLAAPTQPSATSAYDSGVSTCSRRLRIIYAWAQPPALDELPGTAPRPPARASGGICGR